MAFSLIAASAASSSNQGNVTTSSIDSSGADFLVLVYLHAYIFQYRPNAYSDSNGNTWNFIAESLYNGQNPYFSLRVYWCGSPVVGSGHTASAGDVGTTTYPAILLSAWSGGPSSSAVDSYDVRNNQEFFPSNNLYGGSVTPAQDNSLIIAAAPGDGGSSIYPQTATTGFSLLGGGGGTSQGKGLGVYYDIQTTATNRQPYWTYGDYFLSSASCPIVVAFAPPATDRGISSFRQFRESGQKANLRRRQPEWNKKGDLYLRHEDQYDINRKVA
jgi:hypothetical protein